jgi:hypothetical protein
VRKTRFSEEQIIAVLRKPQQRRFRFSHRTRNIPGTKNRIRGTQSAGGDDVTIGKGFEKGSCHANRFGLCCCWHCPYQTGDHNGCLEVHVLHPVTIRVFMIS